MEDVSKDTVIKRRGYRSCINAAFTVLKSNFKTITKKGWWFFLLISLFQSLCGVWAGQLRNGFVFVGFDIQPVACISYIICMALITVVLYSYIYGWINKKTLVWNILRQLKAMSIYIAFIILYTILLFVCIYSYFILFIDSETVPLTKLMAIGTVVTIIFSFFLVPLPYAVCKYQVEPDCKLRKAFAKSYFVGLKNWGHIFLTLFLAALCVLLADFILCLPTYVINSAQLLSAYGMTAYADEAGMPGNFEMLEFAVFFVANYIRIYFCFFIAYVVYFVYGNISCKIVEKTAQIS